MNAHDKGTQYMHMYFQFHTRQVHVHVHVHNGTTPVSASIKEAGE